MLEALEQERRRIPREAAGGTLGVVVMTRQPVRTAALLEGVRGIAAEIVVALDDRAEPEALMGVADRIVLYPFREPVDRPLPWLARQVRTDWVLTIDDDEVPSAALVRALPELCAEADVTHYSIARRWLYPSLDTYLDDSPWSPDYQLRLLRTSSSLVEFSDDFHRPLVASGHGRFVREPLWHLDTATSPTAARREKVGRYERLRPGMRVGGRALNVAFYLPECRRDPVLTPVTREERQLLERVVSAQAAASPPRARIESVTGAEIDAHWPSGTIDGSVELLEDGASMIAGSQTTLDARVRNTGDRRWSGGRDAVPPVYVAARWLSGGREIEGSALWTPLPAPIAAGASDDVPVHLRAPEAPGEYSVVVRLVHDGTGWLGTEAVTVMQVEPRCRFAILGEAEPSWLLGVLERVPEAEPVLLTRTPERGSYTQAHDTRAFLFDGAPRGRFAFGSVLVARTALLLGAALVRKRGLPRSGAEFLDALAGCRVLVVRRETRDQSRRERWSRCAAVSVARVLRVPVTSETSEALRLLGAE
jgi:hypothetical protein